MHVSRNRRKEMPCWVVWLALLTAAICGHAAEEFLVRSLDARDPIAENRAALRDILTKDGIVAFTGIKGLSQARKDALGESARCITKSRSAAGSTAVLGDGSTRYSWAGYAGESYWSPLQDIVQCPGLKPRMEGLRNVMDLAAEYFGQLLDESIRVNGSDKELFPREDGSQYNEFSEIITRGKHLDHFHVYEGKKSTALPSVSTLEVHVDQGLFIGIIPAVRVSKNDIVRKDDDSFIIRSQDNRDLKVRFPSSGDVAVFMVGDGINFVTKGSIYPLYAVPHALILPWETDPGLRSWFGRMFFTPTDARVGSTGVSFTSIISAVLDSPSTKLGMVSCSPGPVVKRVLDDISGQNCSAGELYCWMGCVSISGLSCPEESIRCQKGNGELWTYCESCNDPSAKLVCPTTVKTPIELTLLPDLLLRYTVNSTHGQFRTISSYRGYIGLGIGRNMANGVAIIGMDPTSNPGRSAVGLYRIVDDDGNLQEIATTASQLAQYGISNVAFTLLTSTSEMSFEIERYSQQAIFQWMNESVDIIYASGPLAYGEHYEFGRQRSLSFIESGQNPNSPSFSEPYVVKQVLVAHVVVMIVAWLFMAPLGVLAASLRTPKHRYPHAISNHWFKLHWGLQTVAVVLGYCGMVLGYVSVNGRRGSHWSSPHKICGLVVLLLSIIQPLAGRFRPAKPEFGQVATPMRRAFEIAHPLLGYILLGLAFTTAILGVTELQSISGRNAYVSFEPSTTPVLNSYQGSLGIAIIFLTCLFVVLIGLARARVLVKSSGASVEDYPK